MKCTNCGAVLADSAKFCPECGTKVVRGLFCAECGTKLEAGAKFCPECGTKVGDASSAEKALLADGVKYCKIEGDVLVGFDAVMLENDYKRLKKDAVVVIPEGVKEIGKPVSEDALYNIKEIDLPHSLKKIVDGGLYACGDVEENPLVIYNGTKAEFKNISLGRGAFGMYGLKEIQCKDGILNLENELDDWDYVSDEDWNDDSDDDDEMPENDEVAEFDEENDEVADFDEENDEVAEFENDEVADDENDEVAEFENDEVATDKIAQNLGSMLGKLGNRAGDALKKAGESEEIQNLKAETKAAMKNMFGNLFGKKK